MKDYKKHLISEKTTIKEALLKLSSLKDDTILFVVNQYDMLIGSVTDGDIRRGLINGFTTENNINEVANLTPKSICSVNSEIDQLITYRENNYRIIPLVDTKNVVLDIINFRIQKSYLPIDAVIMAGGLGSRLKPLTDNTPKPLLKVGGKEIISYNFDRLYKFGITNQHVTVNYLAEQLEDYCESYDNQINFNIVKEEEFLGTAGSLSLINDFGNDTVLLMNSDLLTNVDYEDFYKSFKSEDADIMVASIPYPISLPYAIFQLEDKEIKSFKEKPEYVYYANAGIYLIKKEVLDFIPKKEFFNATDLMQAVIDSKGKLTHFPIRSYWLDIGKHQDFEKAQKDIKYIDFD